MATQLTAKEKLDKLYYTFIENGFSEWQDEVNAGIKEMQKQIGSLDTKLLQHILTRGETCPIVKKKRISTRDTILIITTFITSLSGLAAVITLIIKLKELS